MTAKTAPAPYPPATKLLALAILFVGTLAVFANISAARQMDVISYWAAAVLALGGKAAAAYDVAAHKAVQDGVALFAGGMPFAYPPPFLIVLLPFGMLPYGTAALLWIAATYLFYLAAARKLVGSAWPAAAFPPVLVNAIIGQTGFLTAGLIAGAAVALPRRPFLAGALLGCLVIKPQLALFVPFALVAGRQWRAIAGAAASSGALLLVALLLFGGKAYAAAIAMMPLAASIVSDGLVGWHKMASVYAALRLAGLSPGVALAGHALVALAALAMTCAAWRRPLEPGAKMAVLVAASALASPYLYIHDTTMLIVPFAWLAARGEDPRLLALLWCIPLLSLAQNAGLSQSFDPMPLVPIGLLLLLGRRLLADRRTAAG